MTTAQATISVSHTAKSLIGDERMLDQAADSSLSADSVFQIPSQMPQSAHRKASQADGPIHTRPGPSTSRGNTASRHIAPSRATVDSIVEPSQKPTPLKRAPPTRKDAALFLQPFQSSASTPSQIFNDASSFSSRGSDTSVLDYSRDYYHEL